MNTPYLPGPGDDEPIEDRVTCWACDGSYPSDYMVDWYLIGPVCELCDAKMMAAEKQEEEKTT